MKQISISLFLLLCFLLFESPSLAASNNPNWMASNWGIRIVLPAGNSDLLNKFDAIRLVKQISKLKTPAWVMINATQGGYGGLFTTPLPELNNNVHHSMSPKRDLMREVVDLLNDEGFRVLVYFAAEGPLGRHPERKKKFKIINKSWKEFLDISGTSNEDAITNHILEKIAVSFGADIDGWWFDHGKWGEPRQYISAVKKGNERALIAWNQNHKIIKHSFGEHYKKQKIWGLRRSNDYEDYTAGHVTPTAKMAPWNDANEATVIQVEDAASKNGSRIEGLIPHWLIPLQRVWHRGKAGFTLDRIIDWTERLLKSDGAVTWSVALKQPNFHHSQLESHQYKQLKALDNYLLKNRLVPGRTKQSPTQD